MPFPKRSYESFRLDIEMGNDDVLNPQDVARLLKRVSDKIKAGNPLTDDGKIIDSNGNTVGQWSFTWTPRRT